MPLSRFTVFHQVDVAAFILHVQSITIVCPRTKLQRAILGIKGEILHIDFALTSQHNWGKPLVFTIVKYLNTRRQFVQVSTKIDRFIGTVSGRKVNHVTKEPEMYN